MFKISISDLSVSLKAGESTNTIFELGNFETDTLKTEISVMRGSQELGGTIPWIPAAISINFSGPSTGHDLSQH